MKVTESKAKKYMRAMIEDYQDPLTLEYGTTELAEDALDHFKVDEEAEVELTEDMHDWALEVSWELEG